MTLSLKTSDVGGKERNFGVADSFPNSFRYFTYTYRYRKDRVQIKLELINLKKYLLPFTFLQKKEVLVEIKKKKSGL